MKEGYWRALRSANSFSKAAIRASRSVSFAVRSVIVCLSFGSPIILHRIQRPMAHTAIAPKYHTATVNRITIAYTVAR